MCLATRARGHRLETFGAQLDRKGEAQRTAPMILRLSRFIHRLPLGEGRFLVVHALSHMRLTADAELAALFEVFSQPQEVAADAPTRAAIEALIERGILTDKTP